MTCKVGVVEDNLELASLLDTHLSSYGCEVSWASPDNMSVVDAEPWDDVEVVIIDCPLDGDTTGGDLLDLVRAARPGVPTVLTTGWDLRGLDLDNPPNAIFFKPYEPTALVDTVRALSHENHYHGAGNER